MDPSPPSSSHGLHRLGSYRGPNAPEMDPLGPGIIRLSPQARVPFTGNRTLNSSNGSQTGLPLNLLRITHAVGGHVLCRVSSE